MSDHPELDGYEPAEERPLRSRRTTLMMRAVVVVTLVALILPGILSAMSFAQATAQNACAAWVAYEVPEQRRAIVRFETFGPGVLGWECYAVTATGESHIVSLGLTPSGPPALPTQPS